MTMRAVGRPSAPTVASVMALALRFAAVASRSHSSMSGSGFAGSGSGSGGFTALSARPSSIPHDGLERQRHREALAHAVAQPPREGEDVGGAGAIVGDDGQRVTRRQSHGALALTAPEARALDQPRRRE